MIIYFLALTLLRLLVLVVSMEEKKVNKIMFNDKIFSIRKTKKLIEEGYNDYLKLKSLQIKGVDYKKYHL